MLRNILSVAEALSVAPDVLLPRLGQTQPEANLTPWGNGPTNHEGTNHA